MDRFYELYLKYKTKYLNLKNGQQSGGNLDNLIDIVSFNVLNFNFNYSLYLFKNYSHQIKQLYPHEITNQELNMIIKNLVKIERKEFELFRKSKLLIIIKSWIKANQIVCLQEVSNELLHELKKIYGTQLVSTLNITTIPNIDDHRVIIIPDSYQIIKIDKLIFDNGIKTKECLITHIQNSNKKEFVVFNLHIHWQSQELDYINFAHQIKKYIESTFSGSIPFIICGDFNGSIDSIYITNFIKEINEQFKLDTNSVGYLEEYTSHDTRKKDNVSWIDHIMTHDLIIHSPTQTTNKVEHYKNRLS